LRNSASATPRDPFWHQRNRAIGGESRHAVSWPQIMKANSKPVFRICEAGLSSSARATDSPVRNADAR